MSDPPGVSVYAQANRTQCQPRFLIDSGLPPALKMGPGRRLGGNQWGGVVASAAAFLEQVRGEGCRGILQGSWSGPSTSYTWETEEINPELRRVTVIAHYAAIRARVDTFSATIPC